MSPRPDAARKARAEQWAAMLAHVRDNYRPLSRGWSNITEIDPADRQQRAAGKLETELRRRTVSRGPSRRFKAPEVMA